MFRGLLAAVRDEASGERARESVRALSRFHRVQASPGYDAACGWVADQVRACGLEAETETVPGDGRTRCLGQLMPQGWEASRAHATLIDGERRERLCDYDAEKLSLILRSAPARGRYPLIDVGEGTRDEHYQGRDVRGGVVLTRGAAQRVHELAVVAPREKLDALRAAAAGAKSVQDVAGWLKSQNLAFQVAISNRPAEEISMNVLPRVFEMREGQIAVIPAPRGASVVQLLQAQDAPLSEQQATPIIEQYLQSRKRLAAAQAEVNAARRTLDEFTSSGGFLTTAAAIC